MRPRPIRSSRRARCAFWPTFENPALVQRSLDYAVSGKVRNQDAVIQFAIALQSDKNREQAWKYIQNNWEKVQAQFTTEMGAVLVSSTGSFCSAEGRASVEQFFSTHKVASSDKALKHALESIDGCIELRKLQEPNLKQVAGCNTTKALRFATIRLMPRFAPGQTLLIDADDTLWENNVYFERAIAAFICYLNHHEYTPAEVRQALNTAERETILSHGYGLSSFTRSLLCLL